MYGTAACALGVYAAASRAQVFGHPPSTYAWLCALALVPQMVGHTSYNYALRYERATLVSVAMLGEPVGATLFAWAFLDEEPGLRTLLGGAAALLGIAVVARSEG
jgi:drug/metabolite transporter (DMT)-like permease